MKYLQNRILLELKVFGILDKCVFLSKHIELYYTWILIIYDQ